MDRQQTVSQREPVLVGIATMERRRAALAETLESLAGQADHIFVYCNDYDPLQLCNSLGEPYRSVSFFTDCPDIGDVGKFFAFVVPPSDSPSGYYLTCDDDLIYPTDYVDTMVAAIERHGRRAAVGFHGRVYFSPVESYYRSLKAECAAGRARSLRCLDDCFEEVPVTILSSGTAGWHASLMCLHINDFADERYGMVIKNMSDILFSRRLNKDGIPRIVIPHESGWIRHTDKIDMTDTIFAHHYNDDALQTEIFNEVRWKI